MLLYELSSSEEAQVEKVETFFLKGCLDSLLQDITIKTAQELIK